ncbi:MAG: NAD(P)-dependent oxidoreductase [Proteobacteria bacterium]|nr:NAD(P)-dependent oxidoreductase [Pseudomonadota bacterium]
MDQALEDIEVVVHWAASLNVPDFNLVLENNHRMVCELYEGARRHAVRRIVYASSNHAFGLYEPGTRLRLDAPYRADTFYGLSKVWGEELGRMYWTKHGIETVALRIGTFMNLPPRNVRELSSWLGLEDLEQLVQLAVEVPGVTFAPVWGISANTRAHYDLTEANVIGYVPPPGCRSLRLGFGSGTLYCAWRYCQSLSGREVRDAVVDAGGAEAEATRAGVRPKIWRSVGISNPRPSALPGSYCTQLHGREQILLPPQGFLCLDQRVQPDHLDRATKQSHFDGRRTHLLEVTYTGDAAKQIERTQVGLQVQVLH